MKQLGTGFALYFNDYDDWTPQPQAKNGTVNSQWDYLIKTYVGLPATAAYGYSRGKNSVYHCPSGQSYNSTSVRSYAINSNLYSAAGKFAKVSRCKEISKLVLLDEFCQRWNSTTAPYGDGVLFGHYSNGMRSSGGESSSGTNNGSYEIAWRHPNFRKSNVLLADGHVQTFGPRPYGNYDQTLWWLDRLGATTNSLVWSKYDSD